MTQVKNSALVLDGNEVKLRLLAERAAQKTPVHVDWVRFTTLCRNQPSPSFDYRASVPRGQAERLFRNEQKIRDLFFPPIPAEHNTTNHVSAILAEEQDPDFHPSFQALELAFRVAAALGPDFTVLSDVGKGHDFYKFRWIIQRNGLETGWVGFMASSDSKKQAAQANTIHVNLFGSACTFATPGWSDRIADIVDELQAVLTRADLALDFFDGYPGSVAAIFDDYKQGRCNVNGRKLAFDCQGDWANGHSRSLYFGTRSSGKVTNAYEKGDQLFGPGVTGWLRVELRYGNKLRVLSSDMLRRPADFFAGASDWHAQALTLADFVVTPEPVPTTPRLPALTVEAECFKNLKWVMATAAPSVAAAWEFLGESFLNIVLHKKRPGRLQNFSQSEIERAFSAAKDRFFQPEGDALPFVPA